MQKKNGISLIVLVITIIVMVILAGAIVLTLNNSGIIGKASEAVDKTNLATVKELAQTAWAEAYMNGAKTDKEFQEAVEAILEKNKVDVEEYGIVATTSGVKVAKGWLQDGLTVVKGDKTLKIGADFEYDETGEGTTDVAWKVLGASDEGELLIMSTSDIVSSYVLGDVTGEDLDEAVNDYLNGAAELDGLCEPYGKGKSATGARSIRIEDVDKITGFDKTTWEQGKIYGYGNEVTYSYAGVANKIKYYSEVTKPEKEVSCSTFYYLDETNKLTKADLATGTGIITKLKSNYYYYYAPELETIDKTSDAYTMLFGEYENEDTYYWLASPYVYTGTDHAHFGLRFVEVGRVYDCYLWASNGNTYYYEIGVRAVVSLSSNIQVEEAEAGGWTY